MNKKSLGRSIPATIDYLYKNSEKYSGTYLRRILDSAVDEWVFNPPIFSEPVSPDFRLEYTKSGNISYVIIKAPMQINPIDKYIIWSHSMTSNISSNFYYLQTVAMEHEVNIVLYDYPGYGRTPWNNKEAPDEKSYYKALMNVINHFRNVKKIKDENLFLVGHELGCAITLEYVIKTQWKQPIMFIDCFTSVGNLIVRCNQDYITKQRYDEDDIAGHITHFRISDRLKDKYICPIKMVHGMDNKICPISDVVAMNYKYSQICLRDRNSTLSPAWISGCDRSNILLRLSESVMGDFLHYNDNHRGDYGNIPDDYRQINYTNYQKVLDNL